MEVTKQNVRDIIEDYLKKERVRYFISHLDNIHCNYSLHMGSLPGGIQVEYDLDNEEDSYIVCQFYVSLNGMRDELYHSEWHSDCSNGSQTNITEEIGEFIVSIRRLSNALINIESKINQIKDICKDYELNFDDLICLKYNFE